MTRKFCIVLFAIGTLGHNRGALVLAERRYWSYSSKLAFAGGGFGTRSGSGSGSKTKKSTGKKRSSPDDPPLILITQQPDEPVPRPECTDLSTPQVRMDHIKMCIERANVSPMEQTKNDPYTICCVDNFLGPQLISVMRDEAESLLPLTSSLTQTSESESKNSRNSITMVPSQSTRWDDETQSVVAYEKVGVLSTQIEGEPEGYAATPCLVEYIVTLTKHLSEKINAVVQLPEYKLSGTQQTNKLAVCLGGGSKYDKHIDNLGHDGVGREGDRRKMTALLYLQPSGSHTDVDDDGETDARGGYFRAYDVPEEGQVKVIAPRGDRLLLFWSDSLVHDVSPSFAPNGECDRRWSLTVWFVADDGGTIRATDVQVAQRHFGLG